VPCTFFSDYENIEILTILKELRKLSEFPIIAHDRTLYNIRVFFIAFKRSFSQKNP
jgi:hypothetical protein